MDLLGHGGDVAAVEKLEGIGGASPGATGGIVEHLGNGGVKEFTVHFVERISVLRGLRQDAIEVERSVSATGITEGVSQGLLTGLHLFRLLRIENGLQQIGNGLLRGFPYASQGIGGRHADNGFLVGQGLGQAWHGRCRSLD